MDEVLAVSLQSMHADMARLDQIAMNLANGFTPGYKRGVASQPALQASFAAHLQTAPAPVVPGLDGPALHVATDVRPASLKSTGQKLDLALAGQGYFEIQTPQGPAYTRQGDFRIDAQGRLVTQQGHPLMGMGGEIVLQTNHPSISANGEVSLADAAPGHAVAQIRIVAFDNEGQLRRLGSGLFSAGAGMRVLNGEEVQLRQGYLENSNVSASDEMTSMVRTMRHFESMQKIAQGYDDMLGTAIRKLGETN